MPGKNTKTDSHTFSFAFVRITVAYTGKTISLYYRLHMHCDFRGSNRIVKSKSLSGYSVDFLHFFNAFTAPQSFKR